MMAIVPNSTTAILLGCVKTKLDHRAKARDLYCSPLWRRRRTYAEGSGLPWLILSAKHGLVEPTRVLRPYDMALGDLRAGQRRAWGGRVVDSLKGSSAPWRVRASRFTPVRRIGMPSRHRSRNGMRASLCRWGDYR